MKKTLMYASAVAAMASVGFTAYADEGWYLRGDVGVNVGGEADAVAETTNGADGALIGGGETDGGALGALGLGYAFANGFRIEGELALRSSNLEPGIGNFAFDANNQLVTGIPGVNYFPGASQGKAQTTSGLLNAFYDFNTGSKWQPYVGAGIGYGRTKAKMANLVIIDDANGTSSAVNGFNDTETGVAYQLAAGLGYELSKRATLDLGYRYFSMPNLNVDGRVASPFASQGNSLSHDYDYSQHDVTIGLRYQLAKPTPPPPPPVDNPVTSLGSLSAQTITDGNPIATQSFAGCFTDPEGGPVTYATVGALPAGLSLSSSGVLSGTPTSGPGTYSVAVAGKDVANPAANCTHTITVKPRRVAPPPPPPCSTLNQAFVVYFEFDKSNLTNEASAVIDNVLNTVKSRSDCAPGSVTVVGHTDTSGNRSYNQRLSARRAATVANALTARGVAANIITQDALGETDLAKQTRDGVKEPLNRRSEVTIIVR